MGVWDAICYIGDGVKGMTPDLSTVKRAGGAAYSFTSATVRKIDQVVRVDGIQKLPQYWPDDDTRSRIMLFTTTLVKNSAKYAVYEGFKLIPGATVATKLVSETMHEVKQQNHKDGMQVDRLEEDLKRSTPKQESFGENEKLRSENAGGGGGGGENAKDKCSDLMVPKISRMEMKRSRI